MQTVDFTDKAERDLEEIIDFTVKHWSNSQAVEYIDALEELAQTLVDNPDIGIKRDKLSAGLFSFPYQSHVLYYIKNSRGVTIVRVLHASMDPVNHL
ncbi:MAG: type II toxin-antitoxin system RelE/ParE family toxin [Gammaproteobacteria bacterium]|nr:MAG: type II toxin-antitoxin system RelE/ParE family toxin [Gammaproteobacteria bacterium]